jgi:2'-5' RNA ligase
MVELWKAGSGVMIGWFLPKDLAESLSSSGPGSEDPSDLHVTVLYLGKELDDRQFRLVRDVVSSTARGLAPLSGAIEGVAMFPASESSDGKDVHVRLADIPRLEFLREHLIHKLRHQGIEPVLNHGYTPHITIAYRDVGAELTLLSVSKPIALDALTVTRGDFRESFPLNGEGVLKVSPTASDVHVDRPLGSDDDDETKKGEADAPNYHEAKSPGDYDDGRDQLRTCKLCAHGGDGYCDLYDFDYKDGWTCDSWTPISKRVADDKVDLGYGLTRTNGDRGQAYHYDGKFLAHKFPDATAWRPISFPMLLPGVLAKSSRAGLTKSG